ncbi:MAG: hypothetical protein IKM30_01690 [Oscillospiraceae bacterium]|nr:hypothetical protein [Oscillospiraceae bacterium]
MKKTWKIALGAVGGAVIAGGLIWAFAFPGLPWYLKVEKEYSHLQEQVKEFPTSISSLPEDAKEYSGFGMTMKASKDLQVTESANRIKLSGQDLTITFSPPFLFAGIPYYDSEEISADALKEFCDVNSLSVPQNEYEIDQLQYSITKEYFTMNNASVAKTFYQLADYKNDTYERFDTIYRLDGKGYRGFLRINTEFVDNISAVAMIYPDRNPNQRISVFFEALNTESILQIADSITLESAASSEAS